MVSRKRRIPVVFDTNVFVRALMRRATSSPNQRCLRLWLLEKRLQLIASDELIAEYTGIFESVLRLDISIVNEWQDRWRNDARTTVVKLGRRFAASRDPDDDLLLATADAGAADYLITNDRDLPELRAETLRTLRFRVLTPIAFLRMLEGDA